MIHLIAHRLIRTGFRQRGQTAKTHTSVGREVALNDKHSVRCVIPVLSFYHYYRFITVHIPGRKCLLETAIALIGKSSDQG